MPILTSTMKRVQAYQEGSAFQFGLVFFFFLNETMLFISILTIWWIEIEQEMWLWFVGVMGGTFALYYWLEDKKMFRPAMPKQFPKDGKKHYTFEPIR